jgi:hypothetical protein
MLTHAHDRDCDHSNYASQHSALELVINYGF